MQRFTRRFTGLAATAALVFASLAFSTAPAGAQETSPDGDVGTQSSCSHRWGTHDSRIGGTLSDGVNIRTGPHNASPACTIVGQAQRSHGLRYDCWDFGTGGTWSHVYDHTTNVSGWIKDDLLIANGANARCPG